MALGVPCAPAAADTLAERRAEAEAVSAELDLLTERASVDAGRYGDASARLAETRRRLVHTGLRLAAARTALHDSQEALARLLVEGYKNGQGGDATAYVLGAGSLEQLVTRMDLLDRVAAGSGDLVDAVTHARDELAAARRELRGLEATQRRAANEARAALRRIRAAVAERSRLLESVRADIRRLVEAEQRRRAQAAAAAAATAAAAASAPAEDVVETAPAPAPAPQPAPAPVAGGVQVGYATWYGPGFEGQPTASGEIFDPTALTAAHRFLAFDTMVRVTNLDSGAAVVVRVNDRGPFTGAIIDLTPAGAGTIGMLTAGSARVRLEPLG
jgi:rare lipoprotein A